MKTGDPSTPQPESPFADPVPEDAAGDSFRESLQFVIYDWIQTEIPSWKPERDPRYRHSSQAMIAAIPGNGASPAGMVYFKNVFDPWWTDKDLSRLGAAAYPWILMILSPCERFYEFEARLREIAHKLETLTIWRPDSPSRTELERLHRVVSPVSPNDEGWTAERRETARQILTNLYVRRGQLIGVSGRKTVSEEIGSGGIAPCLCALLAATAGVGAVGGPGADAERRGTGEANRAMRWASLLASRPELRDQDAEDARDRLIEWWMNSVEVLSRKLQDLPEAFRTTRFWNEVKFAEGHASALQPVFYNLRGGASSFQESVDLIGRHFSWDQGRLLKWKHSLENLGGLALWLPAFLSAQEYLRSAFPLGQESVDRLRESLLQRVEDPLSFLEAAARNEFDERFLQFKKSYMDLYYALHEDALHPVAALRKDKAGVDAVSMRNLDLLSRLRYTDQSYLNSIKMLDKRTQNDPCTLPLRDILERCPRCFCNFNPSAGRPMTGSAHRINGILAEGIDYFRNVLRASRSMILEDLKSRPADDETLKQIHALLGDGAMIPLRPRSIRRLNSFILRHPGEFLAAERGVRRTGANSL
jgi:hypothetical protein